MKQLLAHIVYYKLEPTNLNDLITHIEHVLSHEARIHSLRNYNPMYNTLTALKTYGLRRAISTREQEELTALLENFEQLIVDELMWRNIHNEEQQRMSHTQHTPNLNNKPK